MSEFIRYLYEQVDRAVYVWGGQGQNLLEMKEPEKWIWEGETSEKNAERAIALFRRRRAKGIDPIRAFDCSGLIVYFLCDLKHAIPGDRNARGLYLMCDTVGGRPEKAGELVFYSKTAKPADISHVGVYVGDGKVVEAIGRDYGVIETNYEDRAWTFAGHLPQLDPYLEDTEPVRFEVTKPMREGEPYRAMQKALNLAGYGPLDEDGKWGKKSQAAFDGLIGDYAAEPVTHTVTITTEPFTVSVDGTEVSA